jgi:hypothetical protein
MSRRAAAEFSFFLAIPVMVAASSYDLYKSRDALSASDVPMFAVGFVVAFASALVVIRAFIGFVSRQQLRRVRVVPHRGGRAAARLAPPRRMIHTLVRFDELVSTQDELHRLAAEGAPAGTAVVATRQSGGRGARDGRGARPRAGSG